MNLILGNLSGLKAAVLPAALAERSDWDDAIAALGSGVAAAMQAHCNRLFARIEDDVCARAANCSYLSLPRFPLEAVMSLEVKDDETAGWVAQPLGTILTFNPASGLVEFGSTIGSWNARVRATYTGGFWADETEDNSGTLPEGASAVPADLLHAWHLQVQHEIEATNLIRGVAAKRSEDKSGETAAAETKLITRVKEMLQPFVRFA